MPIFKVGDEVLSFDDEGQDHRAIYEIKHIINPDGDHCTLACQNGDDWYYFKLDEVVQYKSPFRNNEEPEKVNTQEIKVGDLVEVISKPTKQWAEGISIGDKFVVEGVRYGSLDIPEGVRSIHTPTDNFGYSYFFPEDCVKLVEEDSFAIREQKTEEKKHSHYYKDVSHLEFIDVYRVLDLYNVTDPCIQHAVKKLLVAGRRGGGKDIKKDLQEAIDTITRSLEMRKED